MPASLGNRPGTRFDELTTNGGRASCPFVLSLSKDRPFNVPRFRMVAKPSSLIAAGVEAHAGPEGLALRTSDGHEP